MGCCQAKPKPKPREDPIQVREESYLQQPIQIVENTRQQVELKSSPPLAVDKFSLSDVESVCGSSKLSEDEKMELLRVTFLLDSKGYKLLKLITVTCFGYIINVQQKNQNESSMKIFFPENVLLSSDKSGEAQRLINKEIEIMKRMDNSSVIQYKSHFSDTSTNISQHLCPSFSIFLSQKEPILFVELTDVVTGTFADYIYSKNKKITDRSFLKKAQDLIVGMSHIHSKKCTTRSLTLETILFSSTHDCLQFCDFGEAFQFNANDRVQAQYFVQLQKHIPLQSPQVQHFIKNNPSRLTPTQANEIWVMGVCLSRLVNMNKDELAAYSSPENNTPFVGEDLNGQISYARSGLMNSLTLPASSLSIKSSTTTEAGQQEVNNEQSKVFPSSSTAGVEVNCLLQMMLEKDENERSMGRISDQMEYLAYRYHLNSIQPRQETDYIKGKRLDVAPEKHRLKEFQDKVVENPNNAQAQAQLSSCYYQNEKDDVKALEHIKKAIQLDGTSGQNYNVLGAIYERMLKFEEAEEAYKNAIEKDKTYSLSLYNLGLLNQKVFRKPLEAEKLYKAAIDLDESNHAALFNLALLQKEDLNQPCEARDSYNKYAMLNSSDSQIFTNLGVLYKEFPETRESFTSADSEPQELFKRAILKNPDDVYALANLSQLQLNEEQGCTTHEIEINRNLSHAKEVNPKYAYTYYVQGLVEMNKETPNWDNAVKQFNLALEQNKTFSLAEYQIGVIFFEIKNKLKESIEKYEKAIIFNPNNYLAYYSLALAQEESLKSTTNHADISKLKYKCLSNYRTAINVNPTYVEAYNNLAVMIKLIAIQEQKLKKTNKNLITSIESLFHTACTLAPHNKIINDNMQKFYEEIDNPDLVQHHNIKSTLLSEQ